MERMEWPTEWVGPSYLNLTKGIQAVNDVRSMILTRRGGSL